MKKDNCFMKVAIEEAKKRKGLTHPNPTVGAVIVKDGKIIGKGFHEKAGKPHAEREAIKDALSKGYDIENSTMYITLEPCCHYGKTPPCTDAIIENKIKRVVVATLDPNPLVAGKGVEILRKKGIEVKVGVLEKQAKNLNEDFFVYIKEKRPFIHLKWAQSIDGKIATFTGSSKWITGKKAREYAHKLRNEATAVLVGTNTALKDNPYLTVRHIKSEKQPIRVLIDKDLKLPLDFNIFNKDAKTVVLTSENADKEKIKKLQEKENIKIKILPLNNGYFTIKDILNSLYEEEIMHLLVEGGQNIITQFLKEGLYDKISVFIAPKIIGEDGISAVGKLKIEDIKDSINLKRSKIISLDEDTLLQFYKVK
ncbi:bifunctional diaminohydroxyphosphoribosylaminopyrimidine deaminase/5-amino-6-(5-phosphoribosylamino)uracil reductase RibD [Hydrogenothermus marinus]|uniref:Riboflavin biosynthesis protein RibD n=1 Tax=Hydrogenothermus marinus TaxID=133270 RepID=A0A3M0BJF2_9AQUI|nr:bifunctional diaminohydroxyphosphoribosylaminopyrimidine deaminase/5-amino-6-(5-phosphoribosylamino)uracil reductase RibD [Hydrogenothermus marinus]RMA97573.1 diaminohydroxyphosphoribosylaminopyrimidine deaminase [Hydrogenothermus marinus]